MCCPVMDRPDPDAWCRPAAIGDTKPREGALGVEPELAKLAPLRIGDLLPRRIPVSYELCGLVWI